MEACPRSENWAPTARVCGCADHAEPGSTRGGPRAGLAEPGGGALASGSRGLFSSHSLDLLGDRSAPGTRPQRSPGPAAAEVAVSCTLQVPPGSGRRQAVAREGPRPLNAHSKFSL